MKMRSYAIVVLLTLIMFLAAGLGVSNAGKVLKVMKIGQVNEQTGHWAGNKASN